MLWPIKNAAVVVSSFLLVVFTWLLRHGCLYNWKFPICNIHIKKKYRLLTVTLVNKKSFCCFSLHHCFIWFEYRKTIKLYKYLKDIHVYIGWDYLEYTVCAEKKQQRLLILNHLTVENIGRIPSFLTKQCHIVKTDHILNTYKIDIFRWNLIYPNRFWLNSYQKVIFDKFWRLLMQTLRKVLSVHDTRNTNEWQIL